MIRIAFDASCLITDQKSGLAYYTQNLIQQLAEAYPDDIELIGHYCNFLGRRKNLTLPQASNISYRPTKLVSAKVLNLLRRMHVWLPFELLIKQRADFHFFPAFLGWPSLFRTPSSPVIHDLTYIDFPQYVSARARHDLLDLVPKSIKRAAFVTTISQTTGREIQQTYGNVDMLITHIPPLAPEHVGAKEAARALQELKLQRPFILFLGNLEPRKNLSSLLEAYEKLDSKLRQTHGLVIAGGEGWNNDALRQQIASLQDNGHNIIQTGYVTDTQRAVLLSKAACLVMPSHYEGFGMPILEAMSYDTPVIASDIPVFHEVANEAALYFSPDRPDELTQQLKKLLTAPSLTQELIQSGQANLKRFGWADIVKRMHEQIEKVV